jgi:hypothetical protein
MFPSLQGKSLIHEITMLYQLHIFTHLINIMAQEATLMPHLFISFSSNKKNNGEYSRMTLVAFTYRVLKVCIVTGI